jgi:nucleoside-diphosphate-sugar epimerase
VDVEDVVRCILAATTDEKLIGEEISVGGPVFLTYRQMVDLLAGHLNVLKPKLLVPEQIFPALSGVLPAGLRDVFAPARLAVWNAGVVASPGIVHRHFGFEPQSVVGRLPAYLG